MYILQKKNTGDFGCAPQDSFMSVVDKAVPIAAKTLTFI